MMRTVVFPAMIFSIMMILPDMAGAQTEWQDLNVPTLENIIRVAFNAEGYVFTSTKTGSIYRSVDNGTTWVRLLTPIGSNETIAGFVVTPGGTILAGTYSGNLYRSPDNGSTWERIIWSWSPILQMTIDLSGTIFAACDGGIIRSYDDGRTWAYSGTGYPLYAVFIKVGLDNRLYACTRTAGLYHSEDHGTTWQTFTPGTTHDTLESVTVLRNGHLFTVSHPKLYRSIDDGSNWSPVDGLPSLLFHLISNDADDLYAGSYGYGLYLTNNEGTTWQKLSDFSRIYGLAFNRNGVMYAAADYRLYRSNQSVYLSVPRDVDFPETSIGDTSSANITLSNRMLTGSIIVASVQSSSVVFSVPASTAPTSIPTGGTLTIPVTFVPANGGAANATLTIETSVGSFVVNLAGDVVSRDYILDKSSIDFGDCAASSTVESSVTITNTASTRLRIDSAATRTSKFIVHSLTFPVYIEPNDSLSLHVTFAPGGSNLCVDTLVINTNAAERRRSVVLYGNFPAMVADSTSLDFGRADAASRQITIINSSIVPLQIDSCNTHSQYFRVIGGTFPLVINNGDVVRLTVVFEPYHKQVYIDTLTFFTNTLSGKYRIPMLGERITHPVPAVPPECRINQSSIDFGEGTLLTTIGKSIWIFNPSVSELRIDSLYTQTAKFSIDQTVLPIYVAAHDSLRVLLFYSPFGSNRCLDTLFINNSSAVPQKKVTLYGNYPVIIADSTVIHFGTTASAYGQIHLTNQSNSLLRIDSCHTHIPNFRVIFGTFPLYIAKGDSAELTINFVPTGAGNYSDSLTLFANTFAEIFTIMLEGGTPSDSTNSIQHPGADDNAVPSEFSLGQNYPNPFNPVSVIAYSIPKHSHVILQIYDPLGKTVVTLVNEYQSAGFKTVQWNGTDDFGQSVSSGIYFYTLRAGTFIQTKRMVLLK